MTVSGRGSRVETHVMTYLRIEPNMPVGLTVSMAFMCR